MLERTGPEALRLMAPRDRLGRRLGDLRLSVIDRCNFRCSYCMPDSSINGREPFLPRKDLLSDDEVVRLAIAFSALGVDRIRLTGGEPLLRPGSTDLVRRLSRVAGIKDLSMTSNGILLPGLAGKLRSAGLNRVTVSLDSLDEDVFARMSGGRGSAAGTLAGIAAAESVGFGSIKINCVVQRGVNDHTVMDLLDHFRGSGHIVRLIEFLDVGNSNQWRREQVVPGREWLERIDSRWPLKPLKRSQVNETAQRYAYKDGGGEIGLINSITQPFCGNCSRARITADGTLYTCLFSSAGIPLKPILRGQADPPRLENFIRQLWAGRSDRYSEIRHLSDSGGAGQEMYRLGG
jgi:cyclic pyranopterin phosphate synthase